MNERKSQTRNVTLKTLADQLKEVSELFHNATFTHIYRELNVEPNGLSNVHQQIDAGPEDQEAS